MDINKLRKYISDVANQARNFAEACEHLTIKDFEDVRQLDEQCLYFQQDLKNLRTQYEKYLAELTLSQKIEHMNSKEKLNDNDCRILLVGGNDKWSNLNVRALQSYLLYENDAATVEECLDAVRKNFTCAEHQARTIRWILRGLRCDHAIRKINYDLENY